MKDTLPVPWMDLAQNAPFEVKKLIFDYADLASIKQLRQVSASWGAVGLEVLLRPTFTVKSFVDIRRLISIGTSPHFSQVAAKTVKTLVLRSHGWDPEYFRMLFTSRNESRSRYEVIDFVPTRDEVAALEELDTMIQSYAVDTWEENNPTYAESMRAALRQVPGVQRISIECPNPFTYHLLQKTWNEYDLEVILELTQQTKQIYDILRYATECGLPIRHFAHERLLSRYFVPKPHSTGTIEDLLARELTKDLETLELGIIDLDGQFAEEGGEENLRALINASPNLHTLKVTFIGAGLAPMTCIPITTHFPHLHTLWLQIACDPDELISFLSLHKATLRRLRLNMNELKAGDGSWRALLERIRLTSGDSLEKFEIYGNMRSEDGDENWMIFPVYKADWTPRLKSPSYMAKEIEHYVLRGHPFPEIENLSF